MKEYFENLTINVELANIRKFILQYKMVLLAVLIAIIFIIIVVIVTKDRNKNSDGYISKSENSIPDPVQMQKIEIVKTAPVAKYGPDNVDTTRSGKKYTEEELDKLIRK